jgi:hypothetical protein
MRTEYITQLEVELAEAKATIAKWEELHTTYGHIPAIKRRREDWRKDESLMTRAVALFRRVK